MGDHLLHPLLREKDAAFKCSSRFSNLWSSREADTSGPWLSLVFHARASPCSPAGTLPHTQPLCTSFPGQHLSCAHFAASWYYGVTPRKFMPWLNALQFSSNNHVLQGKSSLESGELPAAPPGLLSAGFCSRAAPSRLLGQGSAGQVQASSRISI